MRRFPPWICSASGVVVVLLWQLATVRANFNSNWTALFCTGALQLHPPLVASEHIYLFANSTGYDGQFYHYIAHDPALRSDLKSYVDDPRLRYRRILVPLLAYLLAAGISDRIDMAYELIFLLSIAMGVYWSSRFAKQSGLAPAWGLLFLSMPAIPISMDRLVVDVGLAALTAGFLAYSQSPSWRLFVVLAAAPLARETGLLLVLAYCVALAWRREFRNAAIFSLAMVPTVAWFSYVQARTTGYAYGGSPIPLWGVVQVVLHPTQYPLGTPLPEAVRTADYLALAGVLLGFGLASFWYTRAPSDPIRIGAVLFSAMGFLLQSTGHWENVYAYGRVYTPQLLCLSAIAARCRKPSLLLPIAMILPRLAIQLTPQVLGVLRWIA